MFHSRPRRNRQSPSLRSLISETELRPSDLVYPIFVTEGKAVKEEISSMPGQFRLSADVAVTVCQHAKELDIPGVALFPVVPDEKKDAAASESKNPKGLLPSTIEQIKKAVPELTLFTDVAMDPYSSDGHDGVVKDGKILNDETLQILADMALCQAQAGTDFVAPSDMMDGRVHYIRQALDEHGFTEVGILAYTAKYASSFYGPFRDALESAPKLGDKKTYQMDPANSREALREAELDESEGADILMVKPALPYLDVVSLLRQSTHLPIAAYNVSGEYAMLKAACEKGWLEEKPAVLEKLTAIKRAGADMIFSYHALEVAPWLV